MAALGDAASAGRLAGEPNNQYRLLRVVDILLQSGGRPLAGACVRAGRAGCLGMQGECWRGAVAGVRCCSRAYLCPLPPPPLPSNADLDLDARRPPDYDCRAFFLHRPRAQLYRRIDARVEEMVAGGLLTVRLLFVCRGAGVLGGGEGRRTAPRPPSAAPGGAAGLCGRVVCSRPPSAAAPPAPCPLKRSSPRALSMHLPACLPATNKRAPNN